MAKERHLPLGDIGRTEVTPSMEHRASPKVLLVEDSMKSDTPHFQFIFFS